MSAASTPTKDTDGPIIFDVGTAEFADKVLRRSAEVPVVVDFWAAWCGPCRMLGPVLEKEVVALSGKVLLAKVDTEAAPELAEEFRISGIPAVMAFRDGRIVDEFTGARDQRFVRAFLARLVPSAEQQALDQARQHLARGEAAAADALLRPLTVGADARYLPAALLLLSEALLLQGPDRLAEVPVLLDRVDEVAPGSEAAELAERLRQLVGFYRAAQDFGGEARAAAEHAAHTDDPEARYALAAALAQRGDHAAALDHLLALVALPNGRRFRDDGARKALLALFEQLGPQHELVHEARRRLQLIL